MVIQSFWKGRPLGVIERLSIASFLRQGHAFHLYCYDDLAGVPEGCVLKDAAGILPFDSSISVTSGFGAGSLAPFADYFRMSLLAARGGIWSDLDVVCVRPWLDLPSRFVATSLEIPEGPLPNINVVGLEPGDEVATRFLELWKTQRDANDFASGVRLFGSAIESSSPRPVLMPPITFNPVSYRHARYLIEPQEPLWHPRRLKRTLGITERLGRIGDHTYGIHLWSEIWRQNAWNRDARYHPESILEKLKRRYPECELSS